MNCGRQLLVALLVAAARVGWAAGVETGESLPEQKVPSFLRVYVPQAEIGKHSWGAGYLPLDATQFERLLEAAQAAAQGAPAPQAPELVRAQLKAHLAADDVLVGTAVLEIRANGTEPSLLALSPFNLALGPAVWTDQDRRRAIVGAGRDGKMRVQVEGSALSFEWSLRPERLASGALRFHLETPQCSATEIILSAPKGTELSIEPGLSERTDEAGESQWKLELGGSGLCDVRMTPANIARDRRPLTLLRQNVTYEVSTRGVSVNAQLKLDVHGEPIQRVAVDLDPELRLVSARYGEQELAWSATADPESRLSHVAIQLPEPVAGTGRVLQLVAIAPLVTGREWRLPTVRTLGMSWQEGTAEILVPSLFVVDRLTTNGCRQSRITPLPAPLAGESIEIQYFRPGGTIDLLLDQPRERPKAEAGSVVELGANQITNTATLSLSLARSHRKTVQLDVRPGWAIDTVESADKDRSLQWELEETRADKTRLKIQFSTGIIPDSAARLIVRGHRQTNGSEPRALSDLEMLSLDAFQSGARLISVRAADGWELRWQGLEELARRDPLKLSPAEARLFVQPPTNSVILLEPAAAQATVSLERTKPTFTGNIRVDAAVQGNTLTETYAIECLPQGRVERLLVYFSDQREAPLEWNLAGGNSGQFSARKLSAGEQARSSALSGGEVWEVNVRLARTGPFELRAVRSTPWMGEIAIGLASLIDATSQRGSVAVRALTDTGLSIASQGLAPVPTELLGKDHYQTARGAYHYEPAREAAGPAPRLTIAPGPMAGGQSAWAWNCRLESRYASDDLTVHWAMLDIETAGRERIAATLPDGTQLKAIFVNGESFAGAPSPVGTLDISLPHGRAFATLAIQYTAVGSLPSFAASATPLVPSFDIPVLQYNWTVWLPPGFAVVDHDGRLPSDAVLAPSFSQRVLGLLGRTGREKLFNPLSVTQWRAAFTPAESQAARQIVDHFLQDLDVAIASHRAGEPITWAQLLGASGPGGDLADWILLIDDVGLGSVGISAFAAVDFPPTTDHRARAIELLETNRLVLLATGNTVVLSSAESAASETCQLEPVAQRAFAIAPGPLADEVARALQQHDLLRFQPVAEWLSQTEHLAPQPGQALALRSSAELRDWSAYRVAFRGTAAPALRIVRASAIHSLAWAVFLTIAAIGSWKSICSTRALVVCIALCACAALLLPTSYAVLASAALVSALFCLGLRMARAAPATQFEADQSRGSRSSRSSVHEVARAVVLFAVISAAWHAQAQPPRPSHPESASPDAASASPATGNDTVHSPASAARSEPGKRVPADQQTSKKRATAPYKVLVPTNEDLETIAGKYYVPAELFRRLTEQAQETSPRPRGWLISRAQYQGTMARDANRHRLGLSSLRATFDVHVFEEQKAIELPFSRASLSNSPSAVRVNGRVVPATWNETGTALLFNSMSADRHRVEVELATVPQSDTSLSGFDVLIPKLPNSVLELAVPADAPPLELPGIIGEIRVDKERGHLTAHLGPSDRLSVRWSAPSGPEAASPNLEVEELIWVKVRPGTTVLDSKFKYKVLSGRIQHLRLLTDPRLRALPPTSSTSPVASLHTVPGDPQRVEIELKRPAVDQVTLELSFLVTNTSGVGNLRLPRLESAQARATRRWLAATVDPALQPKIQAGEDSRTIELAEFASAWGDAENSPQAAFAIPRGEPIWVLATQPSEPRVAVEQVTALSIDRHASLLNYDAQLSITGGHVFQLRLQGFPGLAVERVSLLEDELQRVARISTGEDGLITVFLNAALDGQQRLTLRGRWDTTGKNSLTAPQLQVLGADTRKCQLQVFRQAAVLVELQKPAGVAAGEIQEAADREGFGAMVAAFNLEKPDSPIQIAIAPNPARAKAVCVTYLRHEGNRWFADFDWRVEVIEGLLDTIQLDVPAQWSEPFSIEPAARLRLNPALGDTRAQLVIQPEKPLSGKHRFVIRGRVALSAGDRLRVPDIVPLRVQELERFVVLPENLKGQPVAWDTFRLNRATLPADLAEAKLKSEGTAYHVAGDRFQATLKAVLRNEAKPRVSLADIQVAWQGDGSCTGVALFDVLANGASACNLAMPEDCQLIQASIDGTPALLSDLGTQPIQLRLASRQLPQRVQILFTSHWTGSNTRRRFVAPKLVDVEVDRTLWSVYGPRAFGAGRAQGTEHATGSDHDLYRMKSISSLVQLAPETLGEHLPEEISRWYVPWKERYATSHVAYDRAQSRGQSLVTKAADIDLVEVDKAFTAVDARLGGAIAPPFGSTESIERLNVQDLVSTRATHAGAQDHVDIRYPNSVAVSYWPRLLSALVVATLAIAGVMVLPATLPTFAPTTVVAVGGLLWWLFLAPSGLGLAAAVLAGWFALRSRRKVRSSLFTR